MYEQFANEMAGSNGYTITLLALYGGIKSNQNYGDSF